MKNNYENLIKYLENNNDENIFDTHIESLKNDNYHEHLILMIIDHFDDEYMLSTSSTSLLKEMFVYYTKHKK
jgi:hypothetical protein